MTKNRDKNKPKRKAKRVILFFVEGDSERIAFERPMARLIDLYYPEERLEVGFCKRFGDLEGGDITADMHISTQKIQRRLVRDFYKQYEEEYKCLPKDLLRIVQIVDMDGTYLEPCEVCAFSPSRTGRTKVFYDSEAGKIECADPEAIKERNKHKSEILSFLVDMDALTVGSKSIPYSVYYFSSNLDHFLHMDANVQSGKRALAEAFVNNYNNDLLGFCRFFREDEDASPCSSYHASWEFIREGSNSIKRGTNINLLLDLIENRELILPLQLQKM